MCKEYVVGDQVYTALLDSGATLNVMTEAAAARMGGEIIHVNKNVQVVDAQSHVSQAMNNLIEIVNIQADITVYMVSEAPADISLGVPFLWKYSEGFRRMIEEFDAVPARGQPKVMVACVAAEESGLEELLNEFPKLVVDGDELPDPDRYYKGRTFDLGLPEEKRDKIYFRSQYPANPQQIEKFRELVIPLIKAGVYRESNLPHNNPVMLVAKSKPGEFCLVVDNRLVNHECKLKGAMAAAPLGVVRIMAGAKIFSTLDCKNAFYSLEQDEKDRQYISFYAPGVGKLELTIMGAKASTSALYQAMTATLGDALYRYALVWADDIIVYSKSMEEHKVHLRDVLSRLEKNGFCISRKKIELGKREVHWLGYIISEAGIRPNREKVAKLASMRRPQNLKELRSVIGMWTYFSSFIPAY